MEVGHLAYGASFHGCQSWIRDELSGPWDFAETGHPVHGVSHYSHQNHYAGTARTHVVNATTTKPPFYYHWIYGFQSPLPMKISSRGVVSDCGVSSLGTGHANSNSSFWQQNIAQHLFPTTEFVIFDHHWPWKSAAVSSGKGRGVFSDCDRVYSPPVWHSYSGL